jgi:hypothetical protein
MITVQWIAVEAIKPSARNRRGRGNALSLPGQAQSLGELFARARRRADFVVDSSRGFDHTRAQIREILRTVATMRFR